MFDANQILGMLMQGGMSGGGQQRVQRAAGGGSPLLDAAMSMLGGSRGGGGGLAEMASGFLGGGSGGGGLAQAAQGLLGGSGQSGGSGGGAMGLLGGLAAAAMQQLGSGAPSSGVAAAPSSAGAAGLDDDQRAQVILRAMINAAKSDGQIDAKEQQKILGRLEEAGAGSEARDFIRAEMARPLDLDGIAAAVDSPHMGVEVYAASLFAIDVDTPAEAAYMRQLAARLGLDSALVAQLHESLEVGGA